MDNNKKIFTIEINGVEESYASVKELSGGIKQLEYAVKNAKINSPALGKLTDQLAQAKKVLTDVSKSTFKVNVAGLDVTTRNAEELKTAIGQLEAKLKNANVGDANYAKLNKTLDAAKSKYDQLTNGVENLSNVFKKGSLVLTIDGSERAINNIKQLEEATETLQKQFSESDFGSAQARALQAELVKAKTKMEQLEQSTEQLTAERKIETISTVANGMVGAFGAATGAVKIFGTGLGINDKTIQKYEENAQATLLVVQGFTGVTQALSGETLKNAKLMLAQAASFLGIGTAATEAGVATKGFGISARTAIASTGIGLLLVAIIAIYTNFDKLKVIAGTVGDYLKEKFGGVVDILNAVKDSVRDVLSAASFGFINDAKTAQKKAVEDAKKEKAKADADKLIADKDIYAARLAALNLSEQRKLELQRNYDKLTYQNLVKSGSATADEVKSQRLALLASEKAYQDKVTELAKTAADADAENRKKSIELSKVSEAQKAKLLIGEAVAARSRAVAEGKATKQELEALSLEIVSATKEYQDKLKEAREKADAKREEQIKTSADFAKREVAISSASDSEKLQAVVGIEEKTLAALKAAFPKKLKLIKDQEETLKEAKKAASDGNIQFLVEQANKEAQAQKSLVDLNEKDEVEALRQKAAIDQQSVEALRNITGVKKEIIDQANLAALTSQKAYNDANLAQEISTGQASLDLLKAQVEAERSANENRFGYLSTMDKAYAQKLLVIEQGKLALLKASGKASVAELKSQQDAVNKAAEDVAKAGAFNFKKAFEDAAKGGSFLANLIGGKELQSIIDGEDAINGIVLEAQEKRITAQLEALDAQSQYLDQVISDSQAKVDALNEEINASVSAENGLEQQLLTAKGAQRDDVIKKLDIERTKQQQLNQQKQAESTIQTKAAAEQKRNDAAKVAAEAELAKAKEVTNRIAAISAAIDRAAAAAAAVQAMVSAVKAAASVPFPANIPALAISTLTTAASIAGAIASAKAIKFADGGSFTAGVVNGRSHAEGGVPMRYQGQVVAEMEGGEHITRKSATARNLKALDTINRLGDKTTFKVIPTYATGGQFVTGNYAGMENTAKADDTKNEALLLLLLQKQTDLYDASISLANRPVVTVVSHVTDAQDKINTIKTQALSK